MAEKFVVTSNSPGSKNYNPWLMAFSNVIFPGGAYLKLRQYGRFFFGYFAIFLFIFIVPFLINLIVIGMIIDSYNQTNKWNSATIHPEKKKILPVLGIVVFCLYLAVSILVRISPGFFMPSKNVCKFVYAFNAKAKSACVRGVESRQSYSEYKQLDKKQLVDPGCDALNNDPTLVVGERNFGGTFRGYCQFKKAVETKDVRYCFADFVGQSCVFYLAADTQDPSYCDSVPSLFKKHCIESIKDVRQVFSIGGVPNCDISSYNNDNPAAVELRCKELFGNFFESLKFIGEK